MAIDKVKHFVAGACLSLPGLWCPPLLIGGFAAGVAKEYYDKTKPNRIFDPLDMIATFAGAGLVAIVRIFWSPTI